MTKHHDKFADYVEHPRYGRGPRYTGLNPRDDLSRGIYLGCNSPPEQRIPETAIVADTTRQISRPVAVTHYYDVKRECRDCHRKFIFFAEEQQHWYESLRFPLESDCVRCVECRKSQQAIANLRARYEELLKTSDRTEKQTLELADCSLTLIEQSVFGDHALELVRSFLNSIPLESKTKTRPTFRQLQSRADLLAENAG